MKFSNVFYRWKGGGQPATGKPGGPIASDLVNPTQIIAADVVPAAGSGKPPNVGAMSNLVVSRFTSVNGWPTYRIALVYLPPSGAAAISADMYIYVRDLDAWFRLNQTAGVALTPGVVSFFDAMALLDLPHVKSDIDAHGLGSFEALLVINDPGAAAPNGLHTFAMAPELTSRGDL